MGKPVEPWELLSEQSVYKSNPFQVVEREFLTPGDHRHFTASILKTPRWTNVIATNEEKDILLVKQYRFGTRKIEWEIPGGVIENKEAPDQAIMRELREETGFVSDNWLEIGVVDQNPAIQTAQCFTFLAENVESAGEQNLDEFEDIEFEFHPYDEVQKLIGEGKMLNAYIISAFYWYDRYLNLSLTL